MKKVLTYRQLFYMFLAISVTPILTLIPNQLAQGTSKSAGISVLISIIPLIPLVWMIILFMKSFPHRNIYEILGELLGQGVAKVIVIIYGIWAFLKICTKSWQYTLNLQTSIMSNTSEPIFFIILILLVLYGFMKGIQTIFRFAEFVLVPILIVIGLYIISALPNVRIDYVLAANTLTFDELCIQASYILAITGNLFLFLFYGDNIKDHDNSVKLSTRLFVTTIIIFSVLAIIVTIISYGIVGNHASNSMATPFYIAMKGISVLNVLKHFEPILIIITFLSDFLGICVYASIAIRCVKWVCSLRRVKFIYVPFAMFIYYLSFVLCRTQFDVEYLYKEIMVRFNLLMEFVIPFVLLVIYYGKREKVPSVKTNQTN